MMRTTCHSVALPDGKVALEVKEVYPDHCIVYYINSRGVKVTDYAKSKKGYILNRRYL